MSDPGMSTMSPPATKTEHSTPKPLDAPPPAKLYGILAEFDSPATIMAAAKRVREAGYRWWDCHVPFPVHGLDKAMGVKPTILPIIVFCCGLTGATLGFLLQWFTNATSFDVFSGLPGIFVRGYDFMISGKPGLSGPTYPVVMFELTILFSAGSAFILALVMNGLPRLYHPVFKSRRFLRTTDDRFFIVIEARDPHFYRDRTAQFVHSLNPNATEWLEA